MPRATEPLHGARSSIRATLAGIGERVAALEAAPLEARAIAMHAVAGALDGCLRPHLAWEERTLCPALERFAPAGACSFGAAMRRQHAVLYRGIAELTRRAGDPSRIRAFTREATRLLATVAAHFDAEERTLFPIIDRVVGARASSATGGDGGGRRVPARAACGPRLTVVSS